MIKKLKNTIIILIVSLSLFFIRPYYLFLSGANPLIINLLILVLIGMFIFIINKEKNTKFKIIQIGIIILLIFASTFRDYYEANAILDNNSNARHYYIAPNDK